MKLYYPLCNKDFCFENIFSTESISPPSFYPIRNFGIDYFYKIYRLHRDNLIILFTSPPSYTFGHNDGETIKFIAEISLSALNSTRLIQIAEDIYAYPATIYLNKENFRILFFSERDKRMVTLKSETSLPTKGVKKYEKNFALIQENDCKDFDLGLNNSVDYEKNVDLQDISFDAKLNYFKGFFYGIACGLLNSGSPENTLLRRHFKEIVNVFAELKNTSQDINSSIRGENDEVHSRKLRNLISETEMLFSKLYPSEVVTTEKLLDFLVNKFSTEFPTPSETLYYFRSKLADDKILGFENRGKFLVWYNQHYKISDTSQLFRSLKRNLEDYQMSVRNTNKWSSHEREKINDSWKETIYKLEKTVQEKFISAETSKDITITGFRYSIEKNTISFDPNFALATGRELEQLGVIFNILLSNPKVGRGEVKKEQLLQILRSIGATAPGMRELMLPFYRYFNNESSEFYFDESSDVYSNLIAFMFNPGSIEKLQNYLESKSIPNQWMAYTFWCTFNGFANVSRNFVKPIFESTNYLFQENIDNNIASVIRKSWGKATGENINIASTKLKVEMAPRKNTADVKDINVVPEAFISFYEEQKLELSKIPVLEFYQLLSSGKPDVDLIEIMKSKGINKKTGGSLISKYKKLGNLFDNLK